MKQEFDKLEMFRDSLNILVKLNCHLSNYYTREQAATDLQRLSKQWKQDEDYVIMTIYQVALSQADAQLRYMVQQTVESLNLPITKSEFRDKWENLSHDKKIELVDSAISLLEEVKKEENDGRE